MTGLLATRAGWFLSAITVLVCLAVLASAAPAESWARGSLLPVGLVLLVLAWEASSVSSPASSEGSGWGSIAVNHPSEAVFGGGPATQIPRLTLGMSPRAGSSVLIWAAFPALMVLSVALAGSETLPLAAGALVLASSLIAFQSGIVDSRIATLRAVRIVSVVLVAVRMIPFGFEQSRPALAGTILGIVGGALLVASFSIGRTVLPSQAVFGFLLAAFAPHQPLSAALFPIMTASVVLLNRRRDLAMMVITVIVAIFCGRWSYPLVVLPLMAWAAARILARRREGDAAAIPAGLVWQPAMGHLVRVVPLFPNALASLPRDLPFLVSAAGLLVLSGLVRPSVAVMYVLIVVGAALAFARKHSENLALPSLLMAMIVILFFGWSGAFGSFAFFPLPLAWVPLLAAIAICLLPIVFGSRWPAGVAAVALCVIGARYGQGAAGDEVHVLARSLRAGESMAVDTGSPRTRVAVAGWALNGAGLDPESRLGTIEFLDESGKGFRKTFRAGDVPDWGSFRRSIAFYSKNSWPSRPEGKISGSGPAAFVSGAGLVAGKLPDGRRISLIRVTADSGLPPGTSLQIEEIHFARDPGQRPLSRSGS